MDNQLQPPSKQSFLPGRISLIISAWLPLYLIWACILFSLDFGSPQVVKMLSSALINSLFEVFLFGTPIVALIGALMGILGLVMKREGIRGPLLGIGLNALLFLGGGCMAVLFWGPL